MEVLGGADALTRPFTTTHSLWRPILSGLVVGVTEMESG